MKEQHNHNNVVYNKPIVIGIILNVAFIAIEIFYGLISNSVALISDAGHNFSDVISLILALIAAMLIKKKSTEKFTYGYKKGSILIALINSILLLVALGVIIWESVHRFYNPVQIDGMTVISVAFIGILINGFTAYLFIKDKEKDLNLKSAFLHMLTDALVSAGVVVSGIFITIYKFYWLDPLVSLMIVGVIFTMTYKLLKETIRLSIDAVPENIDIKSVFDYLMSIEGVKEIHDLHIWSLSTSQVALTVHIVVKSDYIFDNDVLNNINITLNDKFEISHSTIQIEYVEKSDLCITC
ncbi:MAG: cation diffusion facilitator family transporter [Candidatus Kapaibacterium sp.]